MLSDPSAATQRRAAHYHMQKQECEITDPAELAAVLSAGRFATLALSRSDEPYIVTLNYGYAPDESALYFHSATAGLKLEFIQANPRACGTVIEDRGYMMGKCNHAYRSVVFSGEMTIVADRQVKRHGLEVMAQQLEDDPVAVLDRILANPRRIENVTILKLTLTELTGKAGQ